MNFDEAITLLTKGQGGIAEWNRRRAYGEVVPSLASAAIHSVDLRYADLADVDLSDADLQGVNLSKARLCRADLRGARISYADLRSADMAAANLRGAKLVRSNFDRSTLTNCDFSGATFFETILGADDVNGAEFTNASFSRARIMGTLAGAQGLDETVHWAPSTIALDTLLTFCELPEMFLRGCGVESHEIEYFRSRVGYPIRFYSCFISYSHADRCFARRLHDQLQGRNIRCWLDEHQILPGDKIHNRVNEAIRLWDKVLLCASMTSCKSWWVNHEIESAMAKEQRLLKDRGVETLALIPINLDGFMFGDEWSSGWKDQITCRHAPDFKGWEKDNAIFEAQFEKVVAALRADDGGRPRPPTSLL